MKKLSLSLLLALAAFAGAPEPSAFGAGNLDSANPYGLSDEEKHILKNKKAIEALQKSLLKEQQIVQENRERIDGIQSIIEGLGGKISRYDKALEQIEDLNRSVDRLNSKTDAIAKADRENFEQIRQVLQELGSLIDSINEKYVDKERFNKLETAFLQFKNAYETYAKKSDLGAKSSAKIYSEAKSMFRKKAYGDAKIRFKQLVKRHYKPATSSYYLGEIAYRQGRYKDAIAYYKKSASLYDKSSFMPTLLLHTAISFDRIGQKREAKKFYDSVMQLYPKSKAAAVAKKMAAKLK